MVGFPLLLTACSDLRAFNPRLLISIAVGGLKFETYSAIVLQLSNVLSAALTLAVKTFFSFLARAARHRSSERVLRSRLI